MIVTLFSQVSQKHEHYINTYAVHRISVFDSHILLMIKVVKKFLYVTSNNEKYTLKRKKYGACCGLELTISCCIITPIQDNQI